MKQIVIIENYRHGAIATEVESYSDRHVKNAIQKLTGIHPDNIVCKRAEPAHSVYGITTDEQANEKFSSINMWYSEYPATCKAYIKINYATLH